jgi:hypothetical protein
MEKTGWSLHFSLTKMHFNDLLLLLDKLDAAPSQLQLTEPVLQRVTSETRSCGTDLPPGACEDLSNGKGL